MTNKDYMDQYAPEYLRRVEEAKGDVCWWNFTKWLASFTFAGSFDRGDIDYAKKLLGLN